MNGGREQTKSDGVMFPASNRGEEPSKGYMKDDDDDDDVVGWSGHDLTSIGT
jgi:hypothetical protein